MVPQLNKSKKSVSKKRSKSKALADRRTLPSVHVLIAVIAIIECVLLLSFTTYSWIESNSSLVIMNGPQSTTTTDIVNIDIADTLNYQINLDQSNNNADLNTFYRFTENYRYGKASSPNGTTFYFPKKNNTYAAATTFRRGDTTDYNTSYTYFDFDIQNNVGNRDFFFYDPDYTTDPTKDCVFSVEDEANYFSGKTYTDANNQTKNKIDAIKNAMRISLVVTADNQTTTKIYSPTGAAYQAQNALTDGTYTSVDPEKINDYGINYNSRQGVAVNDRQKLFTSKKSNTAKTRVSVRIWFEIMDPDFQRAFNITQNTNNPNAFDAADFAAIAGVAINVNLTFANSANNFVPFYFDDYTFDTAQTNRGNNMTLANVNNDNYKVYFHGWNPDTSSYVDYEMERDTSVNSYEYTRWSADGVPQVVTDHLQSGITAAHLNGSYFNYGTSATSGLKWYLYEQPGSATEFTYKAYSQTTNSSNTLGVGCWDTQMTLVRFNDMATSIVQSGFNKEATNFQYMNQTAVATPTVYHVFVNNSDAGNTYANNFTDAINKKTASMYYDATEQVFKAYVPSTWLNSGGNTGGGTLYFNFSINGQFSYAQTNGRFFARGATAHDGAYQYTALGFHDNHVLSQYTGQTNNNNMRYAQGVGTWNDYEKINFSTELIDAYHKAAYRYFVNIGGSYGRMENTAISYPMVPSADNMLYSAYVPAGIGESTTDLNFLRHNSYNGSVSTTTYDNPNVTWTGVARGNSDTFYPVNESAATSTGYWHLSVLVDGTYENLIYDTLTDADALGTGGANTGVLEYSTDGEDWTTLKNQGNTDDNRIDAYRWYVPCDPGATVYYRWTPYFGDNMIFGDYDDTVFYFEHDTSLGMYCVVTESANELTGSGTPVIRRSASALAATGFEVQVEQSLAEEAEETDEQPPEETPDEPAPETDAYEPVDIDYPVQDETGAPENETYETYETSE